MQVMDDAADVLLAAAKHLLALRTAVDKGDWAALASLSATLPGLPKPVQNILASECDAAKALELDSSATQALGVALCTGGPVIRAGAVDVSGVNVKDLMSAVAVGERRLAGLRLRGDVSGPVNTLVNIAKVMINIRACTKHEDWAGAGLHIKVHNY